MRCIITHPFYHILLRYTATEAPMGVSLTSYADDMNPSASHSNFHKAEQLFQPYLKDIFNWTKNNDLILNPDKSTEHYTFHTRQTRTRHHTKPNHQWNHHTYS